MKTVVLGESLVDLVWHGGDSSPRATAGGGPANVAVGLHRSSVPSRFSPAGDTTHQEHLSSATWQAPAHQLCGCPPRRVGHR